MKLSKKCMDYMKQEELAKADNLYTELEPLSDSIDKLLDKTESSVR